MPARTQRYLEASRRLQRYAEINRNDSAFAKTEGEIVYIFDTSVLEAYWRRSPASVGGKFGTDALFQRNAAEFSGWMSLKFLFEQSLPGMRSTAFVSPAHWNEALERLDRLEGEWRSELKKSPYSEREDRQLRALLEFKGPESELIERARAEKVDELFTTLMSAVSSKDRVKRIFIKGRSEEPAVRDLSLCSDYWSSLTQPIRQEDFRRWLARIHQRRGEQENARGDERRSFSHNNENDALTLATIQSMYRENLPALGNSPKVRFVFVTPDAALHEAYADLEAQLDEEGMPHFIRHPHVYSPLLNNFSMSRNPVRVRGSKAVRQVLSDVEGALDALLPSEMRADTFVSDTTLYRIQDNIQMWSRTVETLCLSHGDYILSDLGGDYATVQDVARLLSSPDVREAAAQSVKAELAWIRDDHFQKISALALRALPSGPQLGGTSRFRAPVKLLDVDLAAALEITTNRRATPPTAWLDHLLANFRSASEPRAMEVFLRDLQAAWADPNRTAAAHLLASCIYFAVGAWDSARSCALLCQERLIRQRNRRSAWMREARYCEALAIRLQLRSRADFQHSHHLLTQNLADARQTLAQVRDRVERATLVLTAAATQVIEDDLQSGTGYALDFLSRDQVVSEFQDALDDLMSALRDIENYEVSGDDGTAQRIRVQGETNRLGALLLQRILGTRLSETAVSLRMISTASDDLKIALEGLDSPPSVTLEIYFRVAEFLLNESEKQARALLIFLANVEKESELTKADLAELGVFRRVALAHLSAVRGPAS